MGRNDGKYNTASPDSYLLLKDFAQKNKQFPTDAERVLWEYIRAKRLSVKFNRQHIIGDYIVENRTLRLHDWGFNVIRFKNEDILRDISGVLEIIKINLNNGNE